MKRFLHDSAASMWSDEAGVLSFEWTLLVTLLVLGVVGGIAAARDAVIDELGDVAQAMQALDGSYTIDFPLVFTIDGVSTGGGSDSGFTDAITYTDCTRAAAPLGQNPRNVLDIDS
jgi:Flp pilus assembly pilin Flp